jgi:hypothetical protein
MLLHSLITLYKYVFVSTIHFHRPVACTMVSIKHKQSLLNEDILDSTEKPNSDVSLILFILVRHTSRYYQNNFNYSAQCDQNVFVCIYAFTCFG